MYSKAKIGGHPIHPMLVAFPITLYFLTFIGFFVYRAVHPSVFWFRLGYFSNYAAVVMALLAAIPGFIDWAVGIPRGTPAKRRGLIHMTLNLLALAVFLLNAVLISGTWNTPEFTGPSTVVLSAIGCLLVAGAGYFGYDLVSRDKVGVDLSPEQERLQKNYERDENLVSP